jgi:hypothetical protein
LAEYRLRRFASDNTATNILYHLVHSTNEDAIILVAKERMAAKLLAFGNIYRAGVARSTSKSIKLDYYIWKELE